MIAKWQAVQCGLSEAKIRGRVEGGDWTRVHPGVYLLRSHPADFETRVRAAGLWAGKGATVIGLAAARWWGMTNKEPGQIEIAVARRSGLRSHADVRVVRRFVHPADTCTERRLRVAARAYAALFGAAALGPAGQPILDRALQRLITLDDARETLLRNPLTPGARLAGRWVRAAGDGTAAETERIFVRLMRSAGIEGWVVNRPVRTSSGLRFPDFRFDVARLIVELDGWAFHSDPGRFQDDRQRQNAFVLEGWLVLRFTWFDLVDRPDWVVSQVVAALNRPR